MKKKLLFILAVGICFAPAVSANTPPVGAFDWSTNTDSVGGSHCSSNIQEAKAGDTDSGHQDEGKVNTASSGTTL